MICCGKGTNLDPFSNVRNTGITKALLPIGNKPMIEFVLEWCDSAPFSQITIATHSEDFLAITEAVELYKKKRSQEVVGISPINILKFDGENTGGILTQFIGNESTNDYIFLPCDFVTDLPPQVLIEQYRSRNDEDIAMSVHYYNNYESIDKKSLTHYYTVYSDDQHLLDIYSKDSVNATKFLDLRTQMVWKFPYTKVSSKLLDSSIYFFSPDSLKVLKEELTDYSTKSATKILRDLARRSWKHSEKRGTVSIFNLPTQCSFIRADNIAAYMESNRYVMKLKAKEQLSQQHTAQAKEKGAATVGLDSVVGDDTSLGERTSVKKTVVGKSCTIGSRCRLTGCVLLDGITLEDDVVLENCIVGSNAKIHSKARLTNCNVEGGYTVPKGSQVKGETLANLFIEGQEIDVESSDDSDYDSEGSESFEDDFEDEFEDDGLFDRS